MLDSDENQIASVPPIRSESVGFTLVTIALALPVVSGVVLLFVTSFGPALAISAATVVVSSILVAIDAGRLENVDGLGRKRDSAVVLFLGMCFLWIVVYPYAFFRRRHFGGADLAIPSILVAVFFVVAPILRAALIPPGLPACTSREVVQLLEQVIRGTPIGSSVHSIDGHREISFDREANRRYGQCVLHTADQDITVNYHVEWLDRKAGRFAVKIPPAGLPACTSQEVVQVLERLIHTMPIGGSVQSIDGHREISFDQPADRRRGQCVVHTEAQDILVNYHVEWVDREKGQFSVKILPADLPLCTNKEVVRLLEQVIRSTPVGASAQSIDGHREISFDEEANRRRGQCVAHIDSQDIMVNYVVEWLDRDKGQFAVRIMEE